MKIPFISITKTPVKMIGAAVEAMDHPPRALITSISQVAEKEVQREIRRLPIKVIDVD